MYKPVNYHGTCSVCTHPVCEAVDGMKALHKYSVAQIFNYAQKKGLSVSQEMLVYHWRRHTNLVVPRNNTPIIHAPEIRSIDREITPQQTAQKALSIVDKKIENKELEPASWKDAMTTIRVAKETIGSNDAKYYLQQLIQIKSVNINDTESDN